VGIETGILTKKLRGARRNTAQQRVASTVANHYGATTWATRQGLGMADWAQRTLGAGTLEAVTGSLRRLSRDHVPAWSRAYPRKVSFTPSEKAKVDRRPQVVYLPSCVSRTMGPSCDDHGTEPLPNKTAALLEKAGYNVVYPNGLADLCCGQPFESKGLPDVADRKSAEVGEALREVSRNGDLPIVSDTSPCSYRLRRVLPEALRPLDIAEFLHDHCLTRLKIRKRPGAVALHVTCSAKKMGIGPKLMAVAKACAEQVIIPENIECCGWAGDKGFTIPELNAHALRTLKGQLPEDCAEGFSNSRTCEIGLAMHSGRPYRSLVYLVDEASEAVSQPALSAAE
jgi:D-lactate dehydrogenase